MRWTQVHWALDAGIEEALQDAMGEGAAEALVGLITAVEALLHERGDLAQPWLAQNAGSYVPDEE